MSYSSTTGGGGLTTGADLSPPSRSSLSSWWKQFKQRQPEDEQQQQQGDQAYQRPKLQHMSHSSSAIGMANNGEESNNNNNTTGNSNNKNLTTEGGKVIPKEYADSPIFGVALNRSIKYANVSISLSDPSGEQFVYGYIPIVVAKCGVYLKKNATTIEGIFRLSGSARRIKELQSIFNSPPRFGKGLDWSGFNVHDAANVLRRYLNNLPEPIIPLYFYQQFREPLKEFSSIVNLEDVNNSNGSTPAIKVPNEEDSDLIKDTDCSVDRYQTLISQLPQLNRQLLMYILDLLSIFAAKADENRMPASNLAAIFQPSLLSHPDHDMSPDEYHLSRAAIEFLIQHSNKFLSHIESIAIQQHEELKKTGKPSPVSDILKDDDDAAGEKNGNSLMVPIQRRHSKSLSSVGQDPPAINTLIVPKQQDASGGDTPDNGSGLLTSLKRSVSFNRKPSLKNRSSSNGSGSAHSHSPPPSHNSPNNSHSVAPPRKYLSRNSSGLSSANSPEIPEESTSQQPVTSASNPTIDQALATSPTQSDSLHPNSAASPRVRNNPLLAVSGNNESNSSLSGITKTVSGSSMDGGEESVDDEEDVQSGSNSRVGRRKQSNDGESSRRNVSRWRRSLMLFSSPSDSQNELNELLDPPPSTDNNNNTQQSSSFGDSSGFMSSSPSKVQGWFKKMKNNNRDRSLSRTTDEQSTTNPNNNSNNNE